MQNYNPLRKGTALVVLVLFIGVSIIPSTVGVDKSSMPTFTNPTIVSIQPSAQTVEKGEWFNVGIYVEPSELIIGVGVDIYFDPTLIQAHRVFEGGDLFPGIPHFYPGTIDNPNGKITDIFGVVTVENAVSDPGYFVNISFIAQQEIGTSPLDLQNVVIADINGQPLPSTVIDGEVTVGEEPPQITNVILTTSDPLDTWPGFGWENFTCTVIDDGTVDVVQLNLTYNKTYFRPDPWKYSTEYFTFPMNKNGNIYYYYTTLTAPGAYTYHIWANDTNGNHNSTLPETFFLPMNADVDESGKVAFMDLIAVSLAFNDEGPNGWIREDIDNNGKVHFMDLVAISMHYNEEWK